MWLIPQANNREMFWFTYDNDYVGDYTITVRATGPSPYFVSEEVSYTLTVIFSCENQVITPSETEDQYYRIGSLQNWYQVPEFGNTDEANCPIDYGWYRDETLIGWTWYGFRERSLVWVSLLNSDRGNHRVAVTATNEAGVYAEAEWYLIVVADCTEQTLSAPPELADQNYKVGDPISGYIVPDFVNSDEYCSVNYELAYDTSQAWITQIDERELQWQTDSNLHATSYTVDIVATG